jgi:hypothetical protein
VRDGSVSSDDLAESKTLQLAEPTDMPIFSAVVVVDRDAFDLQLMDVAFQSIPDRWRVENRR